MNPMNSLPLMMPTAGGAAAADGGQSIVMLVSFGLIFVVFYFMIIRPQNKKQKETEKMLKALKKGDRVQTIGGLRGVVVSVKEDSVIMKVDDNTKLEFVRSAIASVLEQKAADDKSDAEGEAETK